VTVCLQSVADGGNVNKWRFRLHDLQYRMDSDLYRCCLNAAVPVAIAYMERRLSGASNIDYRC
jgi:hypothetical protein